jgi:hypothetical protein
MKFFGSRNIVRRVLLPFEWSPSGSFHARTQMPFRPDGLALWGAELAQASVQRIQSGNMIEAMAAIGPVPAQFFALLPGQGWNELVKLIAADEPPAGWADFGTMEPGQVVQIEVTRDGRRIGPSDGVELAMWGRAQEP